MSGLEGMQVALLEGRMTDAMASLVRRHGGEPRSVPAVRETLVDARQQVAAFVDALTRGTIQQVIFLTGAGVRALFRETEQLGRMPELLAALRSVTTVCRGPKPVAALASEHVPASITVPSPHTTTELLRELDSRDLVAGGIGIVHYGERDAALVRELRARAARVEELCLYEWLLPEDLEPLRALVRDCIDGNMDAIAFTSQVQVRHLFQVATEMGLAADLVSALNSHLVVASLAPTCLNALRTLGVEPLVVPEYSKMGHLVSALAQYLEAHPRPPRR